TLVALMGEEAPTIAPVVPEVRERFTTLSAPAPIESEQARFRLFAAMSTFLRRAAQVRPLLVALDDLHWADVPSLHMLQFLVRELHRTPLLVIGTYRDTEIQRGHPLAQALGELTRRPEVSRIALSGLSEAEVARYVAEVVGTPPPGLATMLTNETEGNPLFLVQTVELLQAEGRLGENSLDMPAWSKIPQTVHEAIGERLDRLSSECNQVLTLAAVCGREFGLEILEELGEVQGEALLDALEEAETAHMVEAAESEPGGYRFTHALIRESLSVALPATRQQRLHRRIGEAMEALYQTDVDAHLAELAFHFSEAVALGGAVKAVAYARRAAARALELLAYEEAARLYDLALKALGRQRPPDPALRCTLLIDLAHAQTCSGDAAVARQTLLAAGELARSLGATDLLTRAALRASRVIALRGLDEPVSRLLEDAERSRPEGERARKAQLLSRLAVVLMPPGEWAKVGELSRKALQLAAGTEDLEILFETYNARHAALWSPASTEERLANAGQALALALRHGDRERELRARVWRIFALLELGDIAAIDHELAIDVALVEALRQPQYHWTSTVYRSTRALLCGRIGEAEQFAEEARKLGQRANAARASYYYLLQSYAIRREQGRLQELEPIVDQYMEQTLPAAIAAELGHVVEARAEFERMAGDQFAIVHRNPPYLLARAALLAGVCAVLQDSARAGMLYEILLPYGERNVIYPEAQFCLGSAAHYLGLLASIMCRTPEAVSHF
ncbi:MAG: ATP-binding protein, partial [Dehalococcoidia bacterium]